MAWPGLKYRKRVYLTLRFRFRGRYTARMVGDQNPRDGGFDWEAAGDLTALPESDLRGELAALAGEERGLGYRLEVLRGRISLLRAELAGRGLASVPAEELACVLLGERRRGST